jgi:hypothetical protein
MLDPVPDKRRADLMVSPLFFAKDSVVVLLAGFLFELGPPACQLPSSSPCLMACSSAAMRSYSQLHSAVGLSLLQPGCASRQSPNPSQAIFISPSLRDALTNGALRVYI